MTGAKVEEEVSSAELTANYRCQHSDLSGDLLSQLLVSEAGVVKGQEFIHKYNYPLVSLKISLCAGYFLREASRLLTSGRYDSCISLASGFSLLTYLIAEKNEDLRGIKYYDSDFSQMIDERNRRIAALDEGTLNSGLLESIETAAFDIENAFRKGRSLRDIFPGCERPIFILDGVSYFLSPGCVNWLFEQMSNYEQSAVTMYYWPNDMLATSELFARVFSDLNQGMILEELKSFWDAETLRKFVECFPHTSDFALAEVEQALVPEKERRLTDSNLFFPVRLITGENPEASSEIDLSASIFS